LEIFISIFKITVLAILGIVQFAMFLRCILSIFMAQDTALYDFLCMITEPVIYPARFLFDKAGLSEGMIFDVPFITTFFVLAFIETILTVIG